MLPGVVAANIWVFFYNEHGLINDALSWVGIQTEQAWLADPQTALVAVIIAAGWKGFAFYFLLLLAGLQSVPQETREAAQVDGAGRFSTLVHVVLPQMKAIIFMSLALGVIATSNYFDGIYLMTGGGPTSATEILPGVAVQRCVLAVQYCKGIGAVGDLAAPRSHSGGHPARRGRQEGTGMSAVKNIKRGFAPNLIMFIALLAVAVPFAWVVMASFRRGNVLTGGLFDFGNLGLDNYLKVFQSEIPQNFVNSIIACTLASVLSVGVGVVAAYGFSRFSFKESKVLFWCLLVVQLVPAVSMVVPLYKLWADFGLFNSLIGLGIAYARVEHGGLPAVAEGLRG